MRDSGQACPASHLLLGDKWLCLTFGKCGLKTGEHALSLSSSSPAKDGRERNGDDSQASHMACLCGFSASRRAVTAYCHFLCV